MKVFMTAGEPSGDALGAALMAALRRERPGIAFQGLAGPQMQAQGMASLFPIDELAIMGIIEVLPKYFHLKARIRQTAEAALAASPDVVVTIDSPDFSLRVAALIKEARPDQRIVHYVAPTVWAWRPERARKMLGLIDQVLALFPFEPPYFERVGLACDFVGHPIAEEPRVTEAEIAAFRAAHALPEGPVLALLPGSRKSEIARFFSTFAAAVTRSRFREVPIVLPTLPHLAAEVRRLSAQLPSKPVLLTGEGETPPEASRARRVAIATASHALAASGTISLELAAARTPMVIGYRSSWLSRKIARRNFLVDTITLINLVTETR
ncbi:MAG: lipid-A-disaccharide synthase, partial [Pseudomonadota bacterium]